MTALKPVAQWGLQALAALCLTGLAFTSLWLASAEAPAEFQLSPPVALVAATAAFTTLAMMLLNRLPRLNSAAPSTALPVSSGRWPHWLSIAIILMAVAARALPDLTKPVSDLFHEGELVGTMTLLDGGQIPILIHGPGRNLLPAWIANNFAPSDQTIAVIRWISAILEAASIGLSALLAYWLTASASQVFKRPRSEYPLVAALCVTLLLIGSSTDLSSSTSRCLFWLISLGLVFQILAQLIEAKRAHPGVLIAFGMVCAIAPLYVYAAGIQTLAIAIVGAGAAFLIAPKDAWRAIAIVAAACGATLVLAFLFGFGPLYFNALRDIEWWALKAHGIWRQPLDSWRVIRSFALFAGLIAVAIALALRTNDARRWWWAVAACGVFLATRDVWERADRPHVTMTLPAIWPLAAMLAGPALVRVSGRTLRFVLLAAIVLLSAYTIGSLIGRPIGLSERTANSVIVPQDIWAIGAAIDEHAEPSSCLLNFTNEGVLYYVSHLRPCGPFFYPIYGATPSGDLIQEHSIADPRHVVAVTSDSVWSSTVDGVPMSERMPRTWRLAHDRLQGQISVGERVLHFAPPASSNEGP